MKVRELREFDDDKLADLYEDKKEAMYALRRDHAIGELKDTSQIRNTRRDLARIHLVRRERELAAETTAKGK
jgi:large subunit ribosomal protein L29